MYKWILRSCMSTRFSWKSFVLDGYDLGGVQTSCKKEDIIHTKKTMQLKEMHWFVTFLLNFAVWTFLPISPHSFNDFLHLQHVSWGPLSIHKETLLCHCGFRQQLCISAHPSIFQSATCYSHVTARTSHEIPRYQFCLNLWFWKVCIYF